MRVLVCSNHAEMIGGADKVFVNQVRCLNARGVECVGLASLDERNRGTPLLGHMDRVPLRTFPKPRLSLRSSAAFLYSRRSRAAFEEAVDAFRPDVVHFHIFHGILTNSLPAACVARGIPFVFTAHEYRLLCPNALMRRNDGTLCEACAPRALKTPAVRYRCVHRSALRSALAVLECGIRDSWVGFEERCAHLFFVSKFIRDLHVRHRPGLAAKSSVVYNFCEFERAAVPDVAESHRKMGGPILYVGRLAREKNVALVVELAAAMPERTFLLAGSGDEVASVQAAVTARKLRNVELLGYRGAAEVRALIDAAAYTIVPSTWYENNPLSVLESLARGTPVLGTSFGGVPEVLERIDRSLIFDPTREGVVPELAARIRGTEPEAYSTFRRRSLEVVDELFGEERYFEATMDVYRRIARSRPAAEAGGR